MEALRNVCHLLVYAELRPAPVFAGAQEDASIGRQAAAGSAAARVLHGHPFSSSGSSGAATSTRLP